MEYEKLLEELKSARYVVIRPNPDGSADIKPAKTKLGRDGYIAGSRNPKECIACEVLDLKIQVTCAPKPRPGKKPGQKTKKTKKKRKKRR